MKELNLIQSGLKAPKGQYNKFGGYSYRSAEDILEAVKPLLSLHKCTLTISDEMVMIGLRIYVKATATIKNDKGESECTTAFAREEETKKGMDASQITGSASSYARKYALNGLLAIDDTKDADATNTHGKEAEKKSEQKQEPKKEQNIPEKETTEANAIAEVYTCKNMEELNACWNKYPKLQARGGKFQKACTDQRLKIESNKAA